MRATATAIAALVLLLLLAGSRAVADAPTDLTTARAQLAAVKSKILAAQIQRDALKAQIGDLLARIDANRRALERGQSQIKAANASMADLTGRIDTQQAALDARAAAVYEEGPASPLALLLDATSFADFEARLQYVGAVARRADQALIAQLGQRKAEQQALRTSLAASLAALQATRAQMAQEVSALTSGLEQQLALLDKEQAAAQALVDELTPQPTPTPTPTPTPPPQGGSVRDLIAQYFSPLGNGMVTKALCVAQLESGFNPNAFNPASGASGVFQFIPSVWPPLSQAAGWGGVSVFNAQANVAVAAWAVQQYGWSMWEADSKACGL